MSAYIVTHDHINALVRFACRHDVLDVPGSEQQAAELLLAENTRSVNFRYSESTPVAAIIYDPQARELSPIEAIKACSCLAYQSCETDDWEQTPACKLLRAIESHAVRLLPGYDDAAWEIKER